MGQAVQVSGSLCTSRAAIWQVTDTSLASDEFERQGSVLAADSEALTVVHGTGQMSNQS